MGGEAALEGAWPDAAAIFRGEMLLCTGVLIAPDLVVTAGHCALGVSRVQLGSVDSTAEGVQRDVIQHWVYPDYLTTLDVMLLQLDSPVDIPPRPIALTCIFDSRVKSKAAFACRHLNKTLICYFCLQDMLGCNFPHFFHLK